MRKGILYVATGPFHLACALTSIRWLRAYGSINAPIAIVTDQPCVEEGVVRIDVPATEGLTSRSIKTRINQLTPWEQTLYLDTDTLTLNDLSSVWDLLGDAELAASLDFPAVVGRSDQQSSSAAEAAATLAECEHDAPYLNSGVMVWRKGARSDNLFCTWHEEWRRFAGIDQKALARAIQKTNSRVAILPSSYNVLLNPIDFPDPLIVRRDGTRVLHYISLNRDPRFLSLSPDSVVRDAPGVAAASGAESRRTRVPLHVSHSDPSARNPLAMAGPPVCYVCPECLAALRLLSRA